MKQVVLFKRQVKWGDLTFQAQQYYPFRIIVKRKVKWILYRGQPLATLSYFATLITDQGHAQWVDQSESQVA